MELKMSSPKRCRHCRKRFITKRNPNQFYCPELNCQRVRKRHWQKHKRKCDKDYGDNQKAAQKRWYERNRDYWRKRRIKRKQHQQTFQGEHNLGEFWATKNDVKMDALLFRKIFISISYACFLGMNIACQESTLLSET